MELLLIRVLEKFGLLKYFNIRVRKSINGHKLSIPLKGRIGLENLLMVEPWLSKLMQEFLKDFGDKDHLVDIGVNVGQTLLKVKTLKPDLNYLGFEPNCTCVSYVSDLVKANAISNVSIYPMGLSREDGVLKLYADNAHASGASVIENFRKSVKVQYVMNVPVVQGDRFFKDFDGVVKLIKIDVEGFESDVLIGLEKTISLHKPMIICEVLPVYSENNKPRLERQLALEELLHKLDYDIYLIDEKKASLHLIPEIGIHGDMGRTNYVFCHRSKANSLARFMN